MTFRTFAKTASRSVTRVDVKGWVSVLVLAQEVKCVERLDNVSDPEEGAHVRLQVAATYHLVHSPHPSVTGRDVLWLFRNDAHTLRQKAREDADVRRIKVCLVFFWSVTTMVLLPFRRPSLRKSNARGNSKRLRSRLERPRLLVPSADATV